MKIKKGDNIIVISGKDRGKEGTVLRAFPKRDLVLVEGIHVTKKHQRAQRKGSRGQILDRELPIHISNVAVKSKEGRSRVGYVREEGKKIRIAKKTGAKL